jgi:hypothetical protein
LLQVSPPICKKISFVEVRVADVILINDEECKPTFYNVEKLLPDHELKFTKWCNNGGSKRLFHN